MGILLFIIATILAIILSPLFFLYAIIRIHSMPGIYKYFKSVAFGIDQLGNVMMAPMGNDVLLKKDAVLLYGDPDQTISHVSGKNYVEQKMTWLGKLICRMLNNAEAQHVEMAAKNEQ